MPLADTLRRDGECCRECLITVAALHCPHGDSDCDCWPTVSCDTPALTTGTAGQSACACWHAHGEQRVIAAAEVSEHSDLVISLTAVPILLEAATASPSFVHPISKTDRTARRGREAHAAAKGRTESVDY